MNNKRNIRTMTLTIKKVRLSGKWMEFWFHEPMKTASGDEDGYHLSCKIGSIHSIMDDVDEDIFYNNGLVGRQLMWKYVAPNWEVVVFPHKDNYQSWIGKYITKKSNKPFKCGEKETQVLDIVYNTQSEKIAFKLSNSIVDCCMCELVKEN